ncbi:MAG: alpha/beta hydrolase [Candidatus Saliniplasma sp.]
MTFDKIDLKGIKDWIKHSTRRQVLVVVAVVLLIILSGFFTWALTPLGPMDEALEALDSDEHVNVTTDRWLVFEPVEDDVDTAYIFYPGARVDHRSYAPLVRDIAEEGFLVVIAPMRLNLAVLSPNAASDVIDSFPDIDTWVIGGHSLGGVMAARYADKNEVDGLILWASYPADDLSEKNISTISIYGSKDGLTTVEDIKDSKEDLPPDTRYVEIEGGNHAQFGWYGEQRGDNEASISRKKQQDIIVRETVNFLANI